MHVLEKKVGQIVEENFIYARALHHLGVDFFRYKDHRLKEICEEKGIERRRIIRSFYQFDSSTRISFEEISSYPLELTLEYLRYSHHTYIKNYLPYIQDLIDRLAQEDAIHGADLSIVFPLFVEDFIRHIYEEEDELFNYISFLLSIHNNPSGESLNNIYKYGSISLTEVRAHHVDEDEMGGLRELIEEFESKNLLTDVIKKEVMAFDREILYHAEIENEILFPQAIKLEEEIFHKIDLLQS